MTQRTRTVTVRLSDDVYSSWERIGKAERKSVGVVIKDHLTNYTAPQEAIGSVISKPGVTLEDIRVAIAPLANRINEIHNAVSLPALPPELDHTFIRDCIRGIEHRLDEMREKDDLVQQHIKLLRLNLARSLELLLMNLCDENREHIQKVVEDLFNS